jgi:tripartite-type tricarboxylate transporter receptor subunit TctC
MRKRYQSRARQRARLAAIALLSTTPVFAQNYPARPIRVVVPFPPGGGADNVARPVAQKLSEALGQQVVVDNRGGASAIIGAAIVAKSRADGHTLLLDALTHAVNPALHKLPFDTEKDFTPVGMIVVNPLLLVVHPSLPVKTVSDVISLAKSRPREMTFASGGGTGSSGHLAGELFKYLSKIDIVHVPYKGGSPALVDLIGGQVQLYFGNISSGLPHVRAGKLKGIAVSSAKRSRSAPEFPTVAESGLPSFEVYEWNALFAPAGTPPQIIARLSTELQKILHASEMQERFFQMGVEGAPGTPQQLGDFVRSEIAKWGKVVRDVGIQPDSR